MEQGPLKKEHWRKSAQWSSLVRKHAQVVADDVHVADIFAKTCRAGIDKKTGVEHKCVSDEVREQRPGLSLSALLPASDKSAGWIFGRS